MWQGLQQVWQVGSTAGRLPGLASLAGWQVGQASMASTLAALTAEWRPLMRLLAKRVCALDTGGSRETPGNYYYEKIQNGHQFLRMLREWTLQRNATEGRLLLRSKVQINRDAISTTNWPWYCISKKEVFPL